MQFHEPTGKFVVDVDGIKAAASCFKAALRYIRKSSNLPMNRYSREGALEPADHAQRMVIEGAEKLGIDLGGRWGNEIDVSDES